MSEGDFLKRWSRRKQEAREEGETPPPALPAEAATPPAPEAPPATEIDLSKLPPIDSITAATDVTAFLRDNIPLELSRAALRRAWGADPAIRDFVGLAENAWDFTDPAAMPGFGPLDQSPEQIAALVDRVVGGVRDTVEKLASDVADEAKNPASGAEAARLSAPGDEVPEATPAATTATQDNEPTIAASQPEGSDDEVEPEPPHRRSHGGALPT